MTANLIVAVMALYAEIHFHGRGHEVGSRDFNLIDGSVDDFCRLKD